MVCGTGNLRSLTDGRFAPRSASLASPLQPPQTAFTAVCNYTYFLHKKVLHFPPADDIILLAVKVDGKNRNSIRGISTVGRTSLQLFIPDAEFLGKAVVVRSAQNLAKIFGALAQLVARYIRIVEVSGSNPLCSTTSPSENTVFGRIFYIIHTKFTHSRPEIAKKGGFPPQISAISLIFGIAILR